MEKKRKIKIVITTPMCINLEIFTIQVNSLVKNITICLYFRTGLYCSVA